jgi:hypothetical protein
LPEHLLESLLQLIKGKLTNTYFLSNTLFTWKEKAFCDDESVKETIGSLVKSNAYFCDPLVELLNLSYITYFGTNENSMQKLIQL